MLPSGSEVLLIFARVSKVECRLVTLAEQSFVSRTGVTHGVCRRASVAMADADEKMSSPASAEAAEMSPEHVAEEVVRGSGDNTSGDVVDRQTEKTGPTKRSLDARICLVLWKGSPGGGGFTTQPVHRDTATGHESYTCLSGRIIQHVSDASTRSVNFKKQTPLWFRLPHDVMERVFELLAYKPDLCRLAVVCERICSSLNHCITKTIIPPDVLTLGVPLLYNRNVRLVHIVCPVFRDNGVGLFIVWYELLSNIRGSLLRVLIITSPAMGVFSFEVLVSLLEEFIRDASLDFVGIYVRRGLLKPRHFSYTQPTRSRLLLAGHSLLGGAWSIGIRVGTKFVTKREVDIELLGE